MISVNREYEELVAPIGVGFFKSRRILSGGFEGVNKMQNHKMQNHVGRFSLLQFSSRISISTDKQEGSRV